MKSQELIELNYQAIRAERIALGGDDLGYDKGWIDGVHTALAWVLTDDDNYTTLERF